MLEPFTVGCTCGSAVSGVEDTGKTPVPQFGKREQL